MNKSKRILEESLEKLEGLEVFGYNNEKMSLVEYGSVMAIISPAMENLCALAEYWEQKAKSPSVVEDTNKSQDTKGRL